MISIKLATIAALLTLTHHTAMAATAPLALDLTKTKNQVEFLAVGSPSAIRIRGKLSGDKPALSGGLRLDGASITGTAKLALDGFDTGIQLRNKHMKEKYLETAKFPEAELLLTKLSLPSTAVADSFDESGIPFEGTLTLHGVKKPITGTANVKKSGNEMKLAFEFKFPLAAYGVETPSFMGIKVTDDVSVSVALAGEAAAK